MAKTKTKDADKGKAAAKAKPKAKAADGPRAKNDAYVMMLFITLVAIAAGSFLMFKDHEEYGGKAAPKEAIPALPKLGTSTPPPAGGAGAGGGGDAPAPKADPMPMPMGP